MISINEIYENSVSMAQKAKHGTIRIADFNRYANLANTDVFNDKMGSLRDLYKLGKAMTEVTPGMSKQVDQLLRPFFIPDEVISVVAGVADLPVNLEYVDSVSADSKSLKWVPKNKVDFYLNSTIDEPTEDYPIYTDYSGGLRVYPDSLTDISVSYYKTPEEVKWNYTLVNNKPVYNPTGSVDFQWDESLKLEILTRILGYIGITIKDMPLVNYAITEENTIS